MKPQIGSARNAIRGFVSLTITFLVLRALESIVLALGFAVVSGGFRSPAPRWSLTSLSAGFEVARYYYFVFGYLIASAMGFLLCWLTGLLSSSRRLAVANAAIFLAHSVAVMFVLDWDVDPAIWVCWMMILIYNVIFPLRLRGVAKQQAVSPTFP